MTLKDIDESTFSQLLDFMYTVTIMISEENAQEILIGSNIPPQAHPLSSQCFLLP